MAVEFIEGEDVSAVQVSNLWRHGGVQRKGLSLAGLTATSVSVNSDPLRTRLASGGLATQSNAEFGAELYWRKSSASVMTSPVSKSRISLASSTQTVSERESWGSGSSDAMARAPAVSELTRRDSRTRVTPRRSVRTDAITAARCLAGWMINFLLFGICGLGNQLRRLRHESAVIER